MPASICDPVSSALRLSLGAEDSQSSSLLDSRLYSSAKSVLLSKIEFEESGDYQSNVLDGLKSKYVVIRPKKPVLENKLLKKDVGPGSQLADTKNREEGLPKPKRVLFPVEKVQLGWQGTWSAGAGMQNVGNTCYLNSTLQALFHVPALANWLVSEANHTEKCNQQEACVICGMRATLMTTQKSGGAPVKPWQVYSKLRLICRHLTPGRQEDAHEFLRYLVEAMEKCYLSRFINSDKLDQYSKETTPLNQILGGYLRSTVRCLACHHLSTTYQHFQDLLLDIRKHSTLDEALDSFFSRERLEDLGYKCEACNKKVSATKQFFIERAPMVLCIALKRFSLAGGKLSKHVQFRKKITLNKYIYNKNNPQQLSYKLVSLVTHLGPSQNCGHYTAIGQAPNGNYYQFDDSCVRPLPLSAVLGTNAYIMFFEKDNTSDDIISQPIASTSSAVFSDDKVRREGRGDESLRPKPSRCDSPQGLVVTTKGTHHNWTVSKEKSGPLLSPSLNGVTNKRVKAKEEPRGENEQSPNTSVSSMSPLSDRSEVGVNPLPNNVATAPVSAPQTTGSIETTRHLQGLSHRGYGAPVSSWSGTHSALSRQVFAERREERKRAIDSTDDMDRGRSKKIKKFHHYNRFNNNRNGYNPFQEKQNKPHWGGSFKYRNERRPSHHFNKHHNNKYKRFNRYSNGHHYPRHH
ncbi:unnamed protein product, partial [Iphiclides podalirius]